MYLHRVEIGTGGIREYYIPNLSDFDRAELFGGGLLHLILNECRNQRSHQPSKVKPLQLQFSNFREDIRWLSKVTSGFTFLDIKNLFIWTKIYHMICTAQNLEEAEQGSTLILNCARLATQVIANFQMNTFCSLPSFGRLCLYLHVPISTYPLEIAVWGQFIRPLQWVELVSMTLGVTIRSRND
jgi:hypothetical protein